MRNNRQELLKLMTENPELELIFFVDSDEYCDYSCWSVLQDFRAYKREVYVYERYGDLFYSDDFDEVLEYYMDYFCDEEEYKDLDDETYEERIKEYIEKNIEHKEYIVVYVD